RKDGGEQSAGHRADPARGRRWPYQDGAARLRSDQDGAGDRRVARRLSDQRIRSRYFSAPPVLKRTTLSCFLIVPAATSWRTALKDAAPSGAAETPSSGPIPFMSSTIC